VGAWVVFAVLAVPVLAVVLWLVFDDSIVRIMPGELGLVLVNGTPSGRTLRPGLRFVPTVRRMAVQVYPAFELAYRAGALLDDEAVVDGLEQHGPPVWATLGDRAAVRVAYTVRFRIDPDQLALVHQRFGPLGLFSLVRDASTEVVRAVLNDADTGVADTFGSRREVLKDRLSDAMAERLRRDGFEVSLVSINDLDLGRTGESVQAAVRAAWELERERAEGELRRERARTDADLTPLIAAASHDLALRYREADAWRELAQAYAERTGTLAPPGLRRVPGPTAPADQTAGGDDDLTGP
jgi:regulator of protease activity HflC (stomatin/prohibitin superfamily)